MPELPEIETCRRGLRPHLLTRTITQAIVRETRLRQTVSNDFAKHVQQQSICAIKRRSKYLILQLTQGHVLIHLGMSGNVRVIPNNTPLKKHDHIDLCLDNDHCLRFNDPRRFGLMLWTNAALSQHPLLSHLGPEPLLTPFNADYLLDRLKNRQAAIKNLIMDARIVVGVGNIYAAESLFLAGIHPNTPGGKLNKPQSLALVTAIKDVLSAAIKQGGTSFRDFVKVNGKPGYFKQSLHVYGRNGQACYRCGDTIQTLTIGGRSSFYCKTCQT